MRRPRLLLMATVLVGACSDHPTEPRQELASLAVSANVSGTQVSTLVVRVNAADIPNTLVFNLTVHNGIASGTLQVPPGSARTFLVEAFDALGAVTHDGSATVDVQPGVNPPLSIVLVPRSGQVPITIGIGSVSVVVTPASVQLAVGEKMQMSATITDGTGTAVPGASPTWATSKPGLATVTADGLVTAHAAGEVKIMAVYGGSGAVALLTIVAGG
jgi:hypothetical protein